ncbi:Elongation factor 4 [Gossypium arboreum]|uniref:Elongation factor 4 n=1 Tax=Gossypium arboreum TaxID=29729 RepID=A0A0B0M6E6_GOSAR|nr:Elongation factor 4 [Gossypium arboreum]
MLMSCLLFLYELTKCKAYPFPFSCSLGFLGLLRLEFVGDIITLSSYRYWCK